MAIAQDAELFHTADGTAYATIDVAGHRETWAVGSKRFKEWLSGRYYEKTGSLPRAQQVRDALLTIAGMARYEGTTRTVYLRVAPYGEAIVIDLGNDAWEAVLVTREGWRVVPEPPVRFRRTLGLMALPRPVRGGSIEALRRFINVSDEEAWRLMVAWLVFAFSPTGPYPVLILHGEQGSAKSTAERVLRSLVDPNESPLRGAPRDQDDLMVAAVNGWIVALDNLSSLQPWLSDALCRIATSGGIAKRQLYTDQDEAILQACRPIVLNGITELATRSDLLDRSVLVDLEPIPPGARRPERELWGAFEEYRPALLGAILDAVSAALARLPTLPRPDRLPRMADFAQFLTAAEQALGWEPGGFLAAYEANRAAANEIALEANPVGQSVLELLAREREWTGTAAQLRDVLAAIAPEGVVRSRFWPSNPWSMSNTLNRIAPNLRAMGISVERTRTSDETRERRIRLSRQPEDAGRVGQRPDGSDGSDAGLQGLSALDGADSRSSAGHEDAVASSGPSDASGSPDQ